MISSVPKAFCAVAALSALLILRPLPAQAQGDVQVPPVTINNGAAGIIPSQAASTPEYDLSAQAGEETHPMIRLTPDKPQIVHLDADARSIIVGNPQHLNAVLDTSRSMVLIPRDPGATHITVIGKDDKPIMERYVIVAGPAEKYIRIRRACASAGATGSTGCVQTSIYFCPDMCHETKILSSAMGQAPAPPAPLSSGSSDGAGTEGAASAPAADPSATGSAAPDSGQGETTPHPEENQKPEPENPDSAEPAQ